jgi:hypothetical protein
MQLGFTILGMGVLLFAAAVQAAPPKDPPTKCGLDAVLVGSACIDKYEASVWRIPNPLGDNKGLVKKVRKGKAELQDLLDGGATQLGTTGGDDYTTCLDRGAGCKDDIYAVSLPGVTPSRELTWFQATMACANSGKRLPSNDEWQMAATGSPDPGGDNGTTDCNTTTTTGMLPEDPVVTASRSSCVSASGAYDMVGNLGEWVAAWMPRSTGCGAWGGSDDFQCLAGAETTGEPGALLRGGSWGDGSVAGPLNLVGFLQPSYSGTEVGFRCGR